jgi:hypothetical protein
MPLFQVNFYIREGDVVETHCDRYYVKKVPPEVREGHVEVMSSRHDKPELIKFEKLLFKKITKSF